jgi:hypothetical protein
VTRYRFLKRFLCRQGLAAVLLLSAAPAARAGELYYLLIFGQQQVPNAASYSHTFAAFVKLSWTGALARPGSPRLEVRTISWLPAQMQLRVLAAAPEVGRNCDLHTTLRWSQANGMRTSLWGPYQIRPELYYAAVQQARLLESGQVLYKAIDVGYPSNEACNCIHAVSTVVTGTRVGLVEPGWGESASFRVLCAMEPWIIQPNTVHAWVGSALGLDAYPILYRDWSPPNSGALTGPFFRLLGGERDLQPTYGRVFR